MSLFFILLSVFFIAFNAYSYSKRGSSFDVALIGLWCFSLGFHTAALVSSLA